jgi:hypothetical protein
MGGGRDLLLTGIPLTEIRQTVDLDDYTTDVILSSGGSVVGGASIGPSDYLDLQGNPVGLAANVGAATDPGGATTDTALNILAAVDDPHRETQLRTDLFDIGATVRPGDTIYVYDPDRAGLHDLANQVRYRGQIIFPAKLRVAGLVWPVEDGMGVYFRHGDGTILDLSEWVAWEAAGATIEIGSPPRPLPFPVPIFT